MLLIAYLSESFLVES